MITSVMSAHGRILLCRKSEHDANTEYLRNHIRLKTCPFFLPEKIVKRIGIPDPSSAVVNERGELDEKSSS